MAAATIPGRWARAQSSTIATLLTVSIISPANGGGAPGQTLQAGVFALTNNLDGPVTINGITIAFSRPSLFSSAKLIPLITSRYDVNGPVPPIPAVSPPAASTTFTSGFPVDIVPGITAFALEVTLSPESRNEAGAIAYAAIVPPTGAAQPLWVAFAIVGLATAVLSEVTLRRAWLIAGLLLLFAIGAPGCGGDSGGPSSIQTVTGVSAQADISDLIVPVGSGPENFPGLPLKIGTIFGQ